MFVGHNPADRLVDKLRAFTAALDAEERILLGLLLAPGVARAYADDADVTGFTMTEWSPAALPESLSAALRSRGLIVTGFGPEPDADRDPEGTP